MAPLKQKDNRLNQSMISQAPSIRTAATSKNASLNQSMEIRPGTANSNKSSAKGNTRPQTSQIYNTPQNRPGFSINAQLQ